MISRVDGSVRRLCRSRSLMAAPADRSAREAPPRRRRRRDPRARAAGIVGRDDRRAAGQGFDRDSRQRFEQRGQHEQVGGARSSARPTRCRPDPRTSRDARRRRIAPLPAASRKRARRCRRSPAACRDARARPRPSLRSETRCPASGCRRLTLMSTCRCVMPERLTHGQLRARRRDNANAGDDRRVDDVTLRPRRARAHARAGAADRCRT